MLDIVKLHIVKTTITILSQTIYIAHPYLRVQKNTNTEKISFEVVQMQFLAMQITNQKLSFNRFTVGIILHIFMERDL